MNDVRTRTVVCCYRGRIGNRYTVIDRVKFTNKEYR
jgi:hypothetical protein